MPILPADFSNSLQSKLGKDFGDFVLALQQPAPVSIRINTDKATLQQTLNVVPWSNNGYYLTERPLFTTDPAFHAGAYYVQEASSMFLEQAFNTVVDKSKPITVLDLCAAPGGKTTHLSALMSYNDLLISNEVIKIRASILEENVIKWGKGNVMITNSDPSAFAELENVFDMIVVDAPCSGEGLFRKDPSAMEEWSLANVKSCSERQQRILAQIHSALKPNGCLIYSTCTYNEAENEHNLAWLQTWSSYESVRIKTHTDWGIEEVEHKGICGYRFYPHKVKGEGLFMAILKKSDSNTHRGRYKLKKSVINPLSNKEKENITPLLANKNNGKLLKKGEVVSLWPFENIELAEFLYNKLWAKYAGAEIFEIKGKDYIPLQALATGRLFNKNAFQQNDLTASDALKYLSKADLNLTQIDKGNVVMAYNNLPLGWTKHLGNRTNNMYPKEWRIHMNTENAATPFSDGALNTISL